MRKLQRLLNVVDSVLVVRPAKWQRRAARARRPCLQDQNKRALGSAALRSG
jgi:hypothetical protein